MDKAPYISIVTVCYNCASSIEGTIVSVLHQSCDNIEYIVIDGGSSDGTVDIIKHYENYISYWISEPDKGVYDAMNKAVKVASGEWILFMNSGDCFSSNDVISQFLTLKLAECDVVYGKTIIDTSSGRFIVSPEPLEAMSSHMPFCHQSTFVKTNLMKLYPFQLRYRYVADYDFFLRLYRENRIFKFINIPISIYEIEDGLTASNMSACYLENFKVNGNKVGKVELLIYRCREFLLSILPISLVRHVRNRLYKNNNRFEKIV